MYISKKDLLAITGISYGQLYRWKRERLIPEEWFIKQSSFTGQETFFPREQILSRIRSILELKDRYTLEELAKLLSPEVSKTSYLREELGFLEELDQSLWELFASTLQRSSYEYIEVLVMIMVSEVRKQLAVSAEVLSSFLRALLSGKQQSNLLEMSVSLIMISEHYYTILVKEGSATILDERMKTLYQREFSAISNEIKLKYQERFR